MENACSTEATVPEKSDRIIALRGPGDRETFRLQPCLCLGEISRAHTEPFAKFGGSEPLVITGRRLILLRLKESLQSRFLSVGALEGKAQAVEQLGIVGHALVKLRLGERMDCSGQGAREERSFRSVAKFDPEVQLRKLAYPR